MSYTIKLPDQEMKSLYLLRVEHGRPAIIEQVRQAVKTYLSDQERQLGQPIIKVEREKIIKRKDVPLRWASPF